MKPIDPDKEELRDGRISDWIGYGAIIILSVFVVIIIWRLML